MKARLPSKAAVRARVEGEIKEYAVITTYLFIVFAALAYYKFAILKAHGVDWAPWGFAFVKAAISAKFILIGRALHIGEGDHRRPLIWEALHKSLVFLAFVILLTFVEEVVVGFLHGQGFHESIAGIGGGTPEQMLATAVILFLVFLPLFAFRALEEVMEEKALFRAFFIERPQFEAVNRRAQR